MTLIRITAYAFLLSTTALAAPHALAEQQFDLPVDCAMGTVCVVQNYLDEDPGPGALDFNCGQLTYQGHDGTDIRVPNATYIATGVPVIAAAVGTVRGVRDGIADINFQAPGAPPVAGVECGNGVLLDHGDGWVTQYCHLRKDSVKVKGGQVVAAGEQLGMIGMSGAAEFPHVHLTVRHNNKAVDPFVGPEPVAACGTARTPLWTAKALAALAYNTTGPLNAGFTSAVPTSAEIMDGKHQSATLAPTAPSLVFWAEVYGIEAGDRERFKITQPDGMVFAESTGNPVDKHSATHFAFSGKRNAGAPFSTGVYKGEYVLERMIAGRWVPVVTVTRTMTIR